MATTAIGATFLLLLLLPFCISITQPIFDSHRYAASNIFNEISQSLEDAYEALRVFEILTIEKKPILTKDTCKKVLENLGSSSSRLKDVFYALKVNGILKCKVDGAVFKDISSRLKAIVHDANNLIDIYYSVGSLALIKDQASNVDVLLIDANGVFHSIKD